MRPRRSGPPATRSRDTTRGMVVGPTPTLEGVSYLTDQRDRPVSAFVAVVVALLTAGYMLPWAVAALRGKSNHWTVFWINLLGGWTVILWIVALVMAFSAHKSRF